MSSTEPAATSGVAFDGVPLADIAASEGTPTYVYSAALVRERYRALDAAFGGYPHAIHYAVSKQRSAIANRLFERKRTQLR